MTSQHMHDEIVNKYYVLCHILDCISNEYVICHLILACSVMEANIFMFSDILMILSHFFVLNLSSSHSFQKFT